MRGVASIPPTFAINNLDVDIDFRGQGEIETVAATTGEGDDGVSGCTFKYLIEVTPQLFSPVFQQASCLRREARPYVLPVASATPDFNCTTPLASMSEPPIDLALSALDRPDPDPCFVKTPSSVSPVLASLVTAPASFFNKLSNSHAPAPATQPLRLSYHSSIPL